MMLKSWRDARLRMCSTKAPDGRKKGNFSNVCPKTPLIANGVCENWPERYTAIAFQWWHVQMRIPDDAGARELLYFFFKN